MLLGLEAGLLAFWAQGALYWPMGPMVPLGPMGRMGPMVPMGSMGEST